MKKYLLNSLLYVMLLFVSSASAQVLCQANYTKTNVTGTLTVNFTNTSTAGNFLYFWNFSDGTSSTAMNPTKTYLHSGKFLVCLMIQKADSSCSSIKCDSITVGGNSGTPGCNATYTKTKDASNYLKYFFAANLNDTNYRYFWTFGDNGVSDNRTPNHTYAIAGKYNVCLKVTKKDSTCTLTLCDTLRIEAPAPCNANWSKQNDPINSLKIYFTAAQGGNTIDTNYRYYWTFGDNGVSDGKTPNHIYAHAGKYKVCLKVTKKDSSCTQTICDSILVGSTSNPCNGNWTKQADATNALKIYFTSSNGNGMLDTNYRYFWTFGDNGVSDSKAPNHTYTHAGKYKVCLKVTKKDSSCTVTVCDSILVGSSSSSPCNGNWGKQNDPINALKVYFTAAQGANTLDTNYRYLWTFGDNGVSDNKAPNHTYAHAGKYKVCLKVTKKDSSCTVTVCDSILVGSSSNPCNANFSLFISDSTGANPHYVRFSNTSTGTTTRCIYTFGDGTSSDNCNPIHNFAVLGPHTVCLTIYNIVNSDTLCKSTLCKTFNNAPVTSLSCIANFNYERIGLTNNYRFINRSIGTPLAYTWTIDGVVKTSTKNAEHLFNSPGLHSICLTVKNLVDTNCQSSYCVNIVTSGLGTLSSCIAEFEKQSQTSDPYTYSFVSLAGTNFSNSWNFGDGTYSNNSDATHTYLQEGNYFVCLSVVSTLDSCSDMRCDSVVVSQSTGIKTNELLARVTVYPNPFEQFVSVEIESKIKQNGLIRMTDLTGKIIFESNLNLVPGNNPLKFDLEEAPHGIYLLQVQSGDQQITKKLVK